MHHAGVKSTCWWPPVHNPLLCRRHQCWATPFRTRWRRRYHPSCHGRDGGCSSKHSQDTVGVRLWLRPTSWLQSPRLCSRSSVAHFQSCSHLPFPIVLSWLMSTHLCNAITLFINGVYILLSTWQSPTTRGKGDFKRLCPRTSFHCSGNQSPGVSSFHRTETRVTVLPGSQTPASPHYTPMT